MTEIEALEILVDMPIHSLADYGEDVWAQYEEALEVAIEALEKQISKPPLSWSESTGYPYYEFEYGYECPCCGNRDIDFPDHHCLCGQRLDWSDDYAE